jgi:hypothetical protein
MYSLLQPIPVAARSKEWVSGRSLAGVVGSNFAGGLDFCFERCVLSSRGLCVGLIIAQRIPTECGVSECDRETLTVKWSWPTRGCRAVGKKLYYS